MKCQLQDTCACWHACSSSHRHGVVVDVDVVHVNAHVQAVTCMRVHLLHTTFANQTGCTYLVMHTVRLCANVQWHRLRLRTCGWLEVFNQRALYILTALRCSISAMAESIGLYGSQRLAFAIYSERFPHHENDIEEDRFSYFRAGTFFFVFGRQKS